MNDELKKLLQDKELLWEIIKRLTIIIGWIVAIFIFYELWGNVGLLIYFIALISYLVVREQNKIK